MSRESKSSETQSPNNRSYREYLFPETCSHTQILGQNDLLKHLSRGPWPQAPVTLDPNVPMLENQQVPIKMKTGNKT